MANTIELNVKARADSTEITKLEQELEKAKQKLDEINRAKIESKIEVDSQKLEETRTKIQDLKTRLQELKNDDSPIGPKFNDAEVKKMEAELEKLQSQEIKLSASVEKGKVDLLKKDLESIKKDKIQIPVDTDDRKLSNLKKIIQDLNGEKVELKVDVDDNGIKTARAEITDINGEKVQVDLDVDDSTLKSVRKEVDDMKGDKIDITLDIDDSALDSAEQKVKNLSQSGTQGLNNIGSSVNGVIGAMAGKSIWDTIYGTSKKNETNKILLKNMADTSKSYNDLYKTIDSTTDSSLISMQQLIPALNGIKSATGSTASTINDITPQVAGFGQYVYAMTGSAAKAETAMFDLSKGIKGAFASLDQYGITEDALKNTGLWNGKEDDVVGYMNAVEQVTGKTDELMTSTQGLEALMGKAFSRGGKKIGEELLPHIKNALTGFMQMDTAMDGWLSTGLLAAGGIISGMQTTGLAISQIAQGYRDVKGAYDWAFGEDGKLTGLGSKLSAVKDKAKSVVDGIRNIGSQIAGINYEGKFNALKSALSNLGSSAKSTAMQLGSSLKSALTTVGSVARTTASALADVGKKALISGANALKAGAMWVIEAGKKAISTAITYGLAAAQAVLNFVMSANPIMLVVMAILVLIAVLGYLYFNNEQVRNAIDGFGQSIVSAWNWIVESVSGAVQSIIGFFQGLYDGLVGIWDGIVAFITGGVQSASDSITGIFNWIQQSFMMVVQFFQTYGQLFIQVFLSMATGGIVAIASLIMNLMGIPAKIGAVLQSAIASVSSFVSNLVSRFTSGASRAASGFINNIKKMPQMFKAELEAMIQAAINFASRIVQIVSEAAQRMVSLWSFNSGEHSPGFMYNMFTGEISAMEKRGASNDIADNMGQTAKDMVEAYGSPQFDFGTFSVGSSSSSTQPETTVNVYIENVDSEDRINRLVDVIRREINWHNETAGRSI